MNILKRLFNRIKCMFGKHYMIYTPWSIPSGADWPETVDSGECAYCPKKETIVRWDTLESTGVNQG